MKINVGRTVDINQKLATILWLFLHLCKKNRRISIRTTSSVAFLLPQSHLHIPSSTAPRKTTALFTIVAMKTSSLAATGQGRTGFESPKNTIPRELPLIGQFENFLEKFCLQGLSLFDLIQSSLCGNSPNTRAFPPPPYTQKISSIRFTSLLPVTVTPVEANKSLIKTLKGRNWRIRCQWGTLKISCKLLES